MLNLHLKLIFTVMLIGKTKGDEEELGTEVFLLLFLEWLELLTTTVGFRYSKGIKAFSIC